MTPEQLRASILQYAMEGKLVKQDPNDESASELLQKIEKKKDELIKEKKIRKIKKLPTITDDIEPFSIPKTWDWKYLSDIANITKLAGFEYTKYIKPNLTNKGIPIFKAKNIQSGKTLNDFENYIPEKLSDELVRSQLNKKCLLTPYVGSIGKVAIFSGKYKAHLGSNVGKIEMIKNEGQGIDEEFIMYYLQSPHGFDQLTKYLKSTAQPSISITALREVIVPLPPLEEQKRIVAKIEKLMPLVDEYAESYNRLQKIDNEFEDKLKQSVLQYAMEGKLVKQNPSDEPASELVKASSMEKSHNESYKIPSSWEWVRLGSGVKFINGRAYKKTELLTDSNLTPVLRVGNLFTNSSWYYSDLKLDEDKYIDNGDLIYAWSASFGPRIWNGGHVIYHYHIWKTVIKKSIDKKFLYYFLSDPHNVLGETKLHGSTMKHVTKTNMEKLPFPLPPLEEQKRIVAKIEKIMNSINNH